MSRTFYESDGLVFGTFAAPASEGHDRKRWQLTLTGLAEARGYIVLNRRELRRFITAILSSDEEADAASVEDAAPDGERDG